MDDLKRLNRTLAYEGSIINVYQDHVQVNGKEADWDFMHHDGGAAVIPVTQEGKILMVRQWRNALDRYTLEIPAGKLHFSGESSQTCVMRELEEETGYRSDNVDFLIAINSWPAFTNE
jgi:ADP-ribose pyrophosphatase